MVYDLLLKNGRIIDGSGKAAFFGDLAIKDGKIVELGKLSGQASRVIDVDGLVVSPGFVDNHCHYDAQVTWDPLCTFSCFHGSTTVIIGNCSLALAPVRPNSAERLAEFLSYVEAIPMDVLRTVDFSWGSIAEYMDILDQRLGINVGVLIGHSAVRYYVMEEASQERAANAREIRLMQDVVRDGISAGALGLSLSREKGHYDARGIQIPALWADEEEIFSLVDPLRELSTGIIQSSGGRLAELENRLMSRLSQATGRQVIYNAVTQNVARPNEWKQLLSLVNETVKKGIRSNPMCCPVASTFRFTMHNCQVFRGVPSWHPLQLAPDHAKLQAYRDATVREQLHREVIEWLVSMPDVEAILPRNWYDYIWVEQPILEKNQYFKGKTIREIAEHQGKGIIDAFLDLVVEENLDTVFLQGASNIDRESVAAILNDPNAVVGLSDGGAHVQFQSTVHSGTHLLSYWVRDQEIMPLEQAIRRITFDSATVYGIFDRGLLHPGMIADIAVFNPETIKPLDEDIIHDFPAGGWRVRRRVEGIHYTIVNGQVLIQDGKHTGDFPGRIVRNSRHQSKK